jgi:hypothetical protein
MLKSENSSDFSSLSDDEVGIKDEDVKLELSEKQEAKIPLTKPIGTLPYPENVINAPVSLFGINCTCCFLGTLNIVMISCCFLTLFMAFSTIQV